jgi:hypothetical protein
VISSLQYADMGICSFNSDSGRFLKGRRVVARRVVRFEVGFFGWRRYAITVSRDD